jgi:small conductance mechanosensitive channel
MHEVTIFDSIRACRPLAILVMLLLSSGSVLGQDEDAEQPLIPLTEAELLVLDQMLDKIDADRATIRNLASRLEGAEGIVKTITYARLDQVSTDLLRTALVLAKETISLEEKGKDSGEYRREIEQDLTKLPDIAFDALDRISATFSYKSQDLSAVEVVAEDQRLFGAIKAADEIYQILFDYQVISDVLEINTDELREKIREDIENAAANRSVFLDMAIKVATDLRASATILPENTEIAGELRAADARVKLTAAALQRTIGFLQTLEIETRHYRQQVLTATGQITTDVLDVGVVASLIAGWSAALLDMVIEQGPKLLLKTLLMILIMYLAVKLSRLMEMGINRGLDSSRVQISHLLRRMVVSTGRNLVIMIGFLIALSQIGISLGPLLAGLGIAGFIIGFAMQDALSNFASGMLILFYRPFDVGDTVEAGGVRGKVRSMSLVNTTIMTFDNQALVVPNNLIWSTVIKNVTAQRTRRVDLTFGISYGDDIEKAERVFFEIVKEHDKVLDSPEPMIHVNELGDSSVNFIVRPWVKTEDYWDVYWDITKSVKLRLDEEGISIPFPQRDVHIYESKPAQETLALNEVEPGIKP